MNGTNTPAPIEVDLKSKENHVNIAEAISEMNAVIEAAENLLARIRGEGPTANESTDDTKQCLAEVLQRSADNIRDNNKLIHSIISEIDEYLF